MAGTPAPLIPLTENGRRRAEKLRPELAKEKFARVLVSPMRRARETCDLSGLGSMAVIDPDLGEWNYGEYEGLTPANSTERAGLAALSRRCPAAKHQRKSARAWIA